MPFLTDIHRQLVCARYCVKIINLKWCRELQLNSLVMISELSRQQTENSIWNQWYWSSGYLLCNDTLPISAYLISGVVSLTATFAGSILFTAQSNACACVHAVSTPDGQLSMLAVARGQKWISLGWLGPNWKCGCRASWIPPKETQPGPSQDLVTVGRERLSRNTWLSL